MSVRIAPEASNSDTSPAEERRGGGWGRGDGWGGKDGWGRVGHEARSKVNTSKLTLPRSVSLVVMTMSPVPS